MIDWHNLIAFRRVAPPHLLYIYIDIKKELKHEFYFVRFPRFLICKALGVVIFEMMLGRRPFQAWLAW